MLILPLALITVLLVLAGFHAYWGLGGVWPGHDAASLAATVIGLTSNGRGGPPAMPGPIACFLVALLVAWRAGLVSGFFVPRQLLALAFFGAAFVFFARGVAGYIPAVFGYAAGTPFHDLNRWLYSPLCLAIAAAMLALWMLRAPAAA